MRRQGQPVRGRLRQMPPRFSKTTLGAQRWAGGTFCVMFCLCCLSCSQNADQPPAKQTKTPSAGREFVASADGQVTSASTSSQSPTGHFTGDLKTDDGSSPREVSASKERGPTAPPNVPHEAGASAAARITTPTDNAWFEDMQWDMDPSNDGWDTEVFSELANKQLKHLGEMLVSGHPPTSEQLSELLSEDFSCTALRPEDLQEVFADPSVTVRRPRQLPQTAVHVGPIGLTDSLAKLNALFDGASDKHFKFKLFRVTPNEQEFVTTSYFELSGRIASGAVQETATWRCRWQPGTREQVPKLMSIVVTDYEEVEVRNANQALFSDCTESIFRDVPAYNEQFRLSIDYWRARIENYLGIYYDGQRGLAIGDVNGDGLDDVYLCEPGCLPNRLFFQTPEGLSKDVSADSGIDLLDSTRMALFVDLDNDGDQDMVTPMERQIYFFSNDGTGHFTRKANLPFPGQTAYSLAAADYDQDGSLDVYACFYHGLDEKESNRTPAPIPYHDARSGGFNRLLRNEGNWQFRDVTEEVGLDHNNDRWSFAAVWEDYDNDGDPDLYVANDFGRNNLYRQQGGQFQDVAGPAGAEDQNFGMSASFGDYNRDGWMDIYVSNMFSSAGGRITFQPGFQIDGTSEAISAFQRASNGNTLLRNVGDGTFRDVSSEARVAVGRWAWGSLFADINNDGWEDLLVANGLVTGDLPGDL